MMRKAILCFSSLILSYELCAQNTSDKDSLLSLYTGLDMPDTTRSLAAISLAKLFRFKNSDSANYFAQASFDIAKKITFVRGKALALNMQSLIMKDRGDQVSAIAFFRLSIKEYQKINNRWFAANGYNNLGLTFDDLLKKKEALSCYDSALTLFQSLGDIPKVAETWNNFGQCYRKHGNYLASLDAYFKSLKLYQDNRGVKNNVRMVLANIGIVYEKMKNYPEAVSYYQQALENTPTENLYNRAITLLNLGNAYSMAREFLHSEEALTESRLILKSFDDISLNATLAFQLAYVKIKTGDPDEGIRLLEEAFPVTIKLNYYEAQAECLNSFSEAYLLRSEFVNSLKSANEALRISKLHQLSEQMATALYSLSQVYIQMGNYKKGYEFFQQRTKLNDSLFNEKTIKGFYEIEKEYELDKKQSEIALLGKQNEIAELELDQEQIKLSFILTGLIISLLLLAVIYFFYKTKVKLNNKLSEQYALINSINRDLQDQALRSQMNPHFIFNSLNSIQFLILQNESRKAQEYLSKFALLLRKVMDNSEKNLITLSEEIEILTLYLQLESLRFESSFDFKIDVSVENPGGINIPPLVVQPYLENAIQHGLMPKPDNRQLTVTFSQELGVLQCEVKDNGIGRAKALEISKRKSKLFDSKGMNYTAQRIQVMNKIFSGKSKVSIFDLENDGKAEGTLVKLMFDYA